MILSTFFYSGIEYHICTQGHVQGGFKEIKKTCTGMCTKKLSFLYPLKQRVLLK